MLVSALGETLDRASLAAARKVIVDGFLASQEASAVDVPDAPLGTLYGERLEAWFGARGVKLHLEQPVRRVGFSIAPLIEMADGATLRPAFVVLAVPWTKLDELIAPEVAKEWSWLAGLDSLGCSPITGVHLWFDRPITDLPHAVLVGRLSQWIFHRGRPATATQSGHYYQVVISASRVLAGRDRQVILDEVRREMAEIWPAAAHGAIAGRPGSD